MMQLYCRQYLELHDTSAKAAYNRDTIGFLSASFHKTVTSRTCPTKSYSSFKANMSGLFQHQSEAYRNQKSCIKHPIQPNYNIHLSSRQLHVEIAAWQSNPFSCDSSYLYTESMNNLQCKILAINDDLFVRCSQVSPLVTDSKLLQCSGDCRLINGRGCTLWRLFLRKKWNQHIIMRFTYSNLLRALRFFATA